MQLHIYFLICKCNLETRNVIVRYCAFTQKNGNLISKKKNVSSIKQFDAFSLHFGLYFDSCVNDIKEKKQVVHTHSALVSFIVFREYVCLVYGRKTQSECCATGF